MDENDGEEDEGVVLSKGRGIEGRGMRGELSGGDVAHLAPLAGMMVVKSKVCSLIMIRSRL